MQLLIHDLACTE
uniref:NADH-plastoquinone oxidoreductase subunit 2 n=2 Tax=Pentapetalae TaxID=1437201 RepID=A0A8K1M2D2_9FABA|nr:NADH-plastoquinone oxidoreductase subunit 2 [Toxicopueraria peduncularis]UBI41626.1 NADH-plastoquinone oxidoreductase subunit 2 [Toxicopueraria peduncularis]